MTPHSPGTRCPGCGNDVLRRTYTELVPTCGVGWKIAEWSECGHCHRWLAFHLRERQQQDRAGRR
ncbi:hypothetical protein [Streptomyces hirsutus]|uniref:hypothetical protein n=1 Tax=Streptomyces hirsutus TaxID=35620 RepID=UPI0006E129FF|nr:hypothetical protein [Streptomyces hirsutus]